MLPLQPLCEIYCILACDSDDTTRLSWCVQRMREGCALSGFEMLAILAIGFQSFLLFLALFEPTLRYKVSKPPSAPLDSDEFDRILATLADSALHKCTSIEVLTNGEHFTRRNCRRSQSEAQRQSGSVHIPEG